MRLCRVYGVVDDISKKTTKLLWGLGGSRCSMLDCRRSLIAESTDTDPPKPIGVAAHIAGKRPGSARYDPTMSDADRRAYDNLILLCADCHARIDGQPNIYTVETLRQIKVDHEEWIRVVFEREAPNVGFAELEVVAEYIVSGQAVDNTSYGLVTVKDKIYRNSLSEKVEGMIKIGLSRSNEVKRYLDTNPDARFGSRLTVGFVAEYNKQKNTDLTGDALFLSLADYAAGPGADTLRRVAGLAVLVYLFEACEVFER